MSELLIERSGAVVVLTLNRPESLNALTPGMERAYFDALANADADPDVRVIVVTGAGRGFCAGADLSGSATDLATGGAPLPRRDPGCFPPTMAKPVIAAVNGPCAGVGLAIALHADVRFLAEEAKLTTAFVRRGLIAEHGVAWALPRLVGRGRALDLLLSGRIFTGREAFSYGLAEFCLPADRVCGEALAYARDISQNCSPRAIAAVKRQLAEADLLPPFPALTTADADTHLSFTWPDLIEGIESWQQRRRPAFRGFPPTPSEQR
ncbi:MULTISPECIES: enoyl-CoA hydratase-related protein [unclassified Pseudofrankia]|uniref:enoyl-CoA hydratase-related protein n=1 Tax=unclassified Pseudofrankia TaxID=2994372 RepID=UPI0008DAD8CC|nr:MULTISPECIES: enoyl-CoA hydratase-related protein [unclassified Pseudofrankia]MDT3446718.1 enoyl-CoA hydratase-related protein [Pseudofrankia sp. BMG5.37]OHV57535.1 hypothetical protein BCD48_43020 [Pseudofrankia sp. BMG5.36]